MKIKIVETGEIEDLTAQDWSSTTSWIEWTADLLGNCDELPDQDDDGNYIMDRETYDWWAPVVDQLNTVSYATHTNCWDDFVAIHTDENTGRPDDELEEWYHLTDGDDLECAVGKQIDWLKERGIIKEEA